VIWWPVRGFSETPYALRDWPEWLLKLAIANKGTLRISSPSLPLHKAKDATAAMWKLDPLRWSGDYDGWRYLLNACKAAGISAEEFVKWSTQDPRYAGDADEIAKQWRYAPAHHSGALSVALKEAGIRVEGKGALSPKAPFLFPPAISNAAPPPCSTTSPRNQPNNDCSTSLASSEKSSLRAE
jgi:hypothetical protein